MMSSFHKDTASADLFLIFNAQTNAWRHINNMSVGKIRARNIFFFPNQCTEPRVHLISVHVQVKSSFANRENREKRSKTQKPKVFFLSQVTYPSWKKCETEQGGFHPNIERELTEFDTVCKKPCF